MPGGSSSRLQSSNITPRVMNAHAEETYVDNPYSFGELNTADDLALLNKYCASQSYINGPHPSRDDYILFCKLTTSPVPASYPHAARWYRHIGHFADATVRQWPKGKLNVALPTASDKAAPKATDEDDIDLFGDDAEEVAEQAKKLSEARSSKKEEVVEKKKKQVINKSSLVIEVKPNSVEVDLDDLNKRVKNISIEGVTWGEAYKKVPLAYGLYKLQVSCTIIDDLVETDTITEAIEVLGLSEENAQKYREQRDTGDSDDEEEEDESRLVQSAEIVSFNKL
ncbi:EF-1 guanine nucleotide exchange domain-containing protein [Cardiosporidium cionae]|uniref:EF-1 guanine nucleotide exchange domain-containing protein n=1 Tax=Cardiosporidium cionae TaxID=476202 RepID=A0ABQ7J9H7_9APIC|nr:EF-1 guanine nucleotide exchange domain-containing protein [Cardiosporidium cionae]|eukprot:KAF8820655.1 EF-1 guanine nucleotide exchange domain-containing protein [Cardiosporidium cionae]